MKRIRLRPHRLGLYAIVDDEDHARISRHDWWADVRKRTTYAYRTIRVNGRRTSLRMHREVLRRCRGEVDHVNGDGLDNRRSNLRTATRKQNAHNSRGNGISYKGVTFQPRLKRYPWQARIASDGEQMHIGYYASSIEAARAYDRAARYHFGEYACLNFPNDPWEVEPHKPRPVGKRANNR